VYWKTWDEDRLTDALLHASAREGPPRQDDYLMVAGCLHHARSEVRERAILIGGLRWADPTLLGYFQGALATGSELDDENRRLMIECLVSDCMGRRAQVEPLRALLRWVMPTQPRDSLAAKAAYVGIELLSGRLEAGDYARIDYARVHLPGHEERGPAPE
jgi:hypothetical protein